MKKGLMMLSILLSGPTLLQEVHAQGYYLNRAVKLPDTTITQPLKRFAIPSAIPDVRSVGMGNTRIADENSLSSISYNPGFLGWRDGRAGRGSLVAAAPYQTIDAITFVSQNTQEFNSGFSLRALLDAVNAYRNGHGFKEDVEAKLAKVAAFATDLLNKVVGDPNNPDVQGAAFDVDAQMQVGHWGFSLRGYGQTGMAVHPGTILTSILGIYLSTDFRDSAQASAALEHLKALGDQVIDPVTGTLNPGALPGSYSLTYADLIATAGYGFMIADSLSVGADLKIINRRFSAARISAKDASDITQKLFGDLKSGVTGLTIDIGAVYRTSFGLSIGLNIQNLIPLRVLSSEYSLDYNSVQLQLERDASGNPIVNSAGDTALAAYGQKTTINGPSSLALPLVANVGVMFPIHNDWDASFELVDIGQQVSTFNSYGQRFGFGTEYRLHFFNDNLNVAPRIGFAYVEPTFGLGLGYRHFIVLDAAYYTSRIVRARKTIALQLSITW
jgi:hypothetical protein